MGAPRTIDFEPGTPIAAQYRIIDELGRGANGVVYVAKDDNSGKRVALKFVKNEPRGEDLDCLLREVAIGRYVKHPHVCRLHDIAKTEHDVTFLSMEYVEGGDLEKLLTKIGHLSREKALEIGIELCAGLREIHSKRIVHRDLKPANIMLDGNGHAKITDFGLAVPANMRVQTRGTPLYMAPEQWKQLPPHSPADIYSLGLMLFKMFTGKTCVELPPNWVVSPTPIGDILRAHATARARQPSSEVGGLDANIDYIVGRCLTEDPSRRPDASSLQSLLMTA